MSYSDDDFQRDLDNWGFYCPVGQPGNTAMICLAGKNGEVMGEFCIAPNRTETFLLSEKQCYDRMQEAEKTIERTTDHRDFYEREADIMRFSLARIQQEKLEHDHDLDVPLTPHPSLKLKDPDNYLHYREPMLDL